MTANRPGTSSQFFGFLRDNKWWWLTPLIVVVVAVIALAFFAQRQSTAPFIYLFY